MQWNNHEDCMQTEQPLIKECQKAGTMVIATERMKKKQEDKNSPIESVKTTEKYNDTFRWHLSKSKAN